MENTCPLCRNVKQWLAPEDPFLIADFNQSILVVGEHQFFPGYCMLVLKEHVRDLHDLPAAVQEALFRELMRATQAVAKAYAPWKMNHASYGNVVPHVHWHIIPRSASEPDRESQPWQYAERFAAHATSRATAQEVRENIRKHL